MVEESSETERKLLQITLLLRVGSACFILFLLFLIFKYHHISNSGIKSVYDTSAYDCSPSCL